MRRSKLPLAATGWTVHSGQESSSLAGEPVSPILPAAQNHLLLRYIFEGGKLSRDARLTTLDLGQSSDGQIVVTAADVLTALSADGVDLGVFYATAYEAHESGGGWVRLGSELGSPACLNFTLDLLPPSADSPADSPASAPGNRPRVDVKLFRKESVAAKGALAHSGFYAIGIVGAKTTQNIGSLWRSAFQLGASYIFTVGHRYKKTEATDTLVAHKRMPCFEFRDWTSFVQASGKPSVPSDSAANQDEVGEPTNGNSSGRGSKGFGCPKGAQWVAVEMGGEPLETFEHPERAIYILGSEDTGLPESVVQAAHFHVALPAVRYESYNVAMAGSIVLYDRLAKQATGFRNGGKRRENSRYPKTIEASKIDAALGSVGTDRPAV